MNTALILQHNAFSLEVYDRLHDGKNNIPLPSLAITRNDNPLSSFGTISLLFDIKEFNFDNAETSSCDICSCRIPRMRFFQEPSFSKKLALDFNDLSLSYGIEINAEYISDYIVSGFEQGTSLGLKNAKYHPELKILFFHKNKIAFDANEFLENGEISSTNLHKYFDKITSPKIKKKFDEFCSNYFNGINGKMKVNYSEIIDYESGFVDVDLDMVSNAMKRQIVNAEATSPPITLLKSMVSLPLYDLDDIEDNFHMLASEPLSKETEAEIENEFEIVAKNLASINNVTDDMSYMTDSDFLIDVLKDNYHILQDEDMDELKFILESEYGEISEDLWGDFNKIYSKVKNVKTPYFETKYTKSMSISDAKVAVVPDNVEKIELDILNKHGVNVVFYKSRGLSDIETKINKERAIAVSCEKFDLSFGNFGKFNLNNKEKDFALEM